MSRRVLSPRIRLMRGKRSASPLAWRLLFWIESKATSMITFGSTSIRFPWREVARLRKSP